MPIAKAEAMMPAASTSPKNQVDTRRLWICDWYKPRFDVSKRRTCSGSLVYAWMTRTPAMPSCRVDKF